MPRIRLKSGDELEFVDWVDEPKHKLIFQNKHTRVYSTVFGPTGVPHATLFHRHTVDTVYACVSDSGPGGSALNQEVEDGVLLEPRPVQAHTGLCFCRMIQGTPYIHRVLVDAKNTQELLFLGAEILEPATPTSEFGLAGQEAYQLEAEYERFRVWRLVLEAAAGQQASTRMHRWDFSGVVMLLTSAEQLNASQGSPFTQQPQEAWARGGAYWFDGPVEHELFVTGQGADTKERFEAFVVEWR